MNYKKLPEISKKQESIMDLVFRFRFINRHQLQKIFGYKDPKSVNQLLKDLVAKGFLGRIYSRKLLENTKPAIYYLNNNGIVWLRYNKGGEYGDEYGLDFKYLKKFYEDKHASQTFIDHCLAVCNIYIQLKELEKNSKGQLDYEVSTKTESWILNQLHSQEPEDFQEIKNCISDLWLDKFTNLDTSKMDSSTFFIELIDSHVPRFAQRFKVNEYIRFHEEVKWKTMYTGMDGKFPKILFIVYSQAKLNRLASFIQERLNESYDVEDLVFMLTTYEKVIKEGIENNRIWKEIKAEY